MSYSEARSMPFGDFVRLYKSAGSLLAREQMMAIEAGSFHSYEEKYKKQVMRDLRRASKLRSEEVKDFKEVAANLARRMQSRG